MARERRPTRNPAAVELGRLGGRARLKSTPEKERKEIAAKAGKAAWSKLSHKERSTEMKRRAKVRERNYQKRGLRMESTRRGQMTIDRAHEVCRIFGLRQFPMTIPFATEVGLDFPTRPLTSYEIRVIAAAAAGPLFENASWYIGDLLVYLKIRPDAPVSYDAVVSRCRRAGLKDQTLANYKSVARSFPFAQRHPGVPWVMHSLVRALPRKQRDQLLACATSEKLTPEELRLLVKAARGATPTETIAAKLEAEIKRLYSARPDRNEVIQAVDRCTALLNELREIAAGQAH